MGQPTDITVTTDDKEYSRYESGRDTITATVSVSGGEPYVNEEVYVELVKARRSRDIVVARTMVTLNGAAQDVDVTFHLPDIVDQDLINLVRNGKYLIRARSEGTTEVSGDSPDFAVRIVTVARLKSDFLFGLPLFAGDARFVQMQPTNITGVTVTEVSRAQPLGVFTLTYNYVEDTTNGTTSRTLSWHGGPSVSIQKSGVYVLRSGAGGGKGCGKGLLSTGFDAGYIIVRVDVSKLPTSSTVDDLIIDNSKISDDTLADYLEKAVAWVENIALMTYIEPTVVVTDRDPTTIQFAAGINAPNPIYTDPDWDFIVGPLTYYTPRGGNDWIHIQTPYMNILRVDSLFGSIANTRIIDLDLDWIQFYPQGGLIQVVPFHQTVAFDYLGLLWVNSLRGAAALPNFWHFNMVVGPRDCPPDLQELVAKKAAIDALIMLGAALRPGVGSMSLGRDGVSQSVSYTTQAQYGVYTAQITAFQDWIDRTLQGYKARYRGLNMAVV